MTTTSTGVEHGKCYLVRLTEYMSALPVGEQKEFRAVRFPGRTNWMLWLLEDEVSADTYSAAWRLTSHLTDSEQSLLASSEGKGWWVGPDYVEVLRSWADEVDPVLDSADPIALQARLNEALLDVARLNTEVGEAQMQVRHQRERAERAEGGIEAVRTSHRQDIERIGTRLLEEAERREWCEDYDSIIEDLNERLSVPLEVREKNFEIDVRITYSMTVSVTARDREEAEERINGASLNHTWRPGIPFHPSDNLGSAGIYAHDISVEVDDE